MSAALPGPANAGNGASKGGPKDTRRVITPEEWDEKLQRVRISKEDTNTLVMNYLVTEGFVDAARQFQRESGATPEAELSSIEERTRVRKTLQGGDVAGAIELVDGISPDILKRNPRLLFHLKQQRLIELIRSKDAESALRFAQEELAPSSDNDPALLRDLERTLALLAFSDASLSPVADLLSKGQMQKVANELNAAILNYKGEEEEPRLPQLLKMLFWSQKQLAEQVQFPTIDQLSL